MRESRGKEQSKESSRQFLTFRLGDDFYGLDILRVREIRGWSTPRKIPNLPDFIKGVIDFRGGIVPIIDLRIRFTLDESNYDRETVIILVSIEREEQSETNSELIMGMVVDRVADVMDISSQDIKPKPELGSKLDTRYLLGVVRREERMVLLMDVDKLLDPETFTRVAHLAEH